MILDSLPVIPGCEYGILVELTESRTSEEGLLLLLNLTLSWSYTEAFLLETCCLNSLFSLHRPLGYQSGSEQLSRMSAQDVRGECSSNVHHGILCDQRIHRPCHQRQDSGAIHLCGTYL